MAEIMTLRNAVSEGAIGIGAYIPYKPEYKKVILKKKETGWTEDQVYETQENLHWRLASIEGINKKLILVSYEVPDEVIYLKGYNGYRNSEAVLKKCCERFSCSKLGLKARSMNQKDAQNFIDNDMYQLVNPSNYTIWISSRCQAVFARHTYYGLKAVRFVNGNLFITATYLAAQHINYGHCDGLRILPIIDLPDDVKINITTREFVAPTQE